MDHNILQVKYPSITMYPHHAHLFAIIEGIGFSDSDMLAWLASNYITIQKGPDNLDFFSGYEILTALENCPMLQCLCVPSIIINRRYEGVVDFIKEMIDSDIYIYMNIDEYYIRFYDNYEKNHFYHTLLIYGYDSKKQIVYAADFFKNRKYSFKEILFEEIEKASENSMDGFLEGIRLLRKRPYYYYRFNIELLRKNIAYYINAQLPEEYKRNNDYIRVFFNRSILLFGLDVYDGIITDFENNYNLNVLNCYFIKEHFKAISLILIYLAKSHMVKKFDICADMIWTACEKAEVLINKSIMYEITMRKKIRDEIIESLLEIKQTDYRIMSHLLNNLEETNRFYIDTSKIYLHELNGLIAEGVEQKDYCYYFRNKGGFLQTSFYGKNVNIDIEFMDKSASAEIYIDDNRIAVLSYENINTLKYTKVFENLPDCHHIIRIINNDGHFGIHRICGSMPVVGHGSVELVNIDRRSHGNWINKYGSLGYILPNEHKYPKNASVYFFEKNIYKNDTTETIYMLSSKDSKERIKKCFYRENEQILRVESIGESIFTLYLLDWTNDCSVTGELVIKDADDDTILERQNLEKLEKGCYFSYLIKGITIWHISLSSSDNLSRKYGDVFGCFFDKVSDTL